MFFIEFFIFLFSSNRRGVTFSHHHPFFASLLSASLITYHLSLITSCSSIDCPVQNTVAVYYAVGYDDELGDRVTETFGDTLWVWTQRSDGTDTLLLNRGTGLQTFQLPVSYQHPEDVLVFAISDTAYVLTVDTVWIKKDDIPHFESVDCAAHFFHRLTDVRSTHNRIDTIAINNPSVTYDQTVTNLLIHFK